MRDINIFDSDLFPYLEGEAIKGTTLTLTIRDIRPEKMKNHADQEETKEVLYFSEIRKGFVLNKTNSKRIAEMYGAQTGAWHGKKISLFTEPVQAFGKLHNALRVATDISPNGGSDMNTDKLIWQLNRIPVISGFFKDQASIMECRAEGTGLPDAADMDGWRVLFADARDYALSKIQEAAQSDPPMPQSTAERSAMDDIEAEEDAQMMIDSGQVEAHGPDHYSD